MFDITIFWVVILGFGIPLTAFLLFAFYLSPDINNVQKYFLANKEVNSTELFTTLGASWLSIGNAIFSLIILGLYFGFLNFWTAITWMIGFIILSKHSSQIKKLCKDPSINGFLSSRFGTKVGKIAAITIIVIATSLLSLELIVGMAISSIAAPGLTGDVIAILFGLLLVVAITGYTMLGGLTAVVKSDIYQFILICCALVALLIGTITWGLYDNYALGWSDFKNSYLSWEVYKPLWTWEFILGLVFLQFFLLVSDMGTWQRIISVDFKEKKPWTKIVIVGIVSAIGWLIVILVGMIFSPILLPFGENPEMADGIFTGYGIFITEPLIAILSIDYLFGSLLGTGLVFVILLGLTGAMLSTGDTYLLVSTQAASMDIRNKYLKSDRANLLTEYYPVQFSRKWAWLFSSFAYILALFVIFSGFDFLSVALLLLGSQCAIAPVAVFALREDIDHSKYINTSFYSLLIGFISSVVCGLYFMLFQPEYIGGGFLPAIIAITFSTGIIFISIIMNDGWSKAFLTFPALFGFYKDSE